METITLEISLPKQVLLSLGLSRDDATRTLKRALVLQLVRDERVSVGKAAELLGMGKIEFIELMAQENVPYFDYSSDELDEESHTVDEWRSAHQR